MYCGSCGKEIIGVGAFCQSCGAKVESTEAEPQAVRPPTARSFGKRQTGVNDGRYISAEEREWARLKNEADKAKGAPKRIAIGTLLIVVFIVLFAIRSATYSSLNATTTTTHAIIFLGGGGGYLLYGIYSLVKLSDVRSKLKNMPNYGNRNGK
jgi:hypothetical protein